MKIKWFYVWLVGVLSFEICLTFCMISLVAFLPEALNTYFSASSVLPGLSSCFGLFLLVGCVIWYPEGLHINKKQSETLMLLYKCFLGSGNGRTSLSAPGVDGL